MAVSNEQAPALRAPKGASLAGERWFQLVILALPTFMAITGAWLAGLDDPGYRGLVGLVPLVLCLAGGGAGLLRIPSARKVATVFLSAAMVWALSALAMGYYWYQAGSDPASEVAQRSLTLALFCRAVGIAAPIILMQVFPTGPLGRAWARVTLWGLVGAIVVTSAGLSVTEVYVIPRDLQEVVWTAGLLTLLFGYGSGAAIVVMRYVVSTPIARRQLLAFGLLQLALTATLFGTFITGVQLSDEAIVFVMTLWSLGAIASITLGIVRYQLFDVRFVLSHVAVYTLLAVVLSGVFVSIYLAISAVLSESLAAMTSTWVAVAAAVVVALLVDPVRRWLVRRIEARFLGDRRRPLEAFARLQPEAGGSRDEATFDAVLEAMAAAVRAPGATLELREGADARPVARVGDTGDDPMVLPLSHRGELLGTVNVGRRTPGEEYPGMDRLLLDQMAAQVAARVYAVRRDDELGQTRREALTAISDERARLGRDLHDGLVPLLAGAGLTAEALRMDLAPDSQGEREAARLAERLRHAATEVRSIAHGLDPGEVSQNLDEAVLAYLDGLRGPNLPMFGVHIIVDHVPRVVAHTAYLVVLEALTNVIRHAGAKNVEVMMRIEEESLVLRVVDDGRGIPQPYVSGFGITSMRKRVEALGGILAIGRAEAGGTVIDASIPLAP